MSTKAPLKPRPVRKPRKMTEQTNTTDSPTTITKVQSHRPDVQLIDRHALWDDFQARMKINNYEVGEAFKDLKSVINATKKVGSQLRDKYDDFTKVKQWPG